MPLSEIYKPIKKELGQFEDSFIKQIAEQNGFAHSLAGLLLKSRGKRLRPALVLFSAKINNKEITPPVLSLAVAMELIHTASLIHDDVVDGANLRRKIPTINSKGDNQLAVLMGDYLYSRASIILSDINSQGILQNLAQTTTAMCQSELSQFNRRSDFNLKEEEYLKIVTNKTASLIASSCRNAALLSGASSAQIEALSNYGLNFGIAFQIVDDCLDFTGQEKALGKTLGLDLKRGSLTLPLIYLLNYPKQNGARSILKNIFSSLPSENQLNKVKKLVLESGAVTKAYQKAGTYIDRARESLKIFNSSPAKESLIKLSELCLNRDN